MGPIVLDPGHGGVEQVGSSRSNRAVGPQGTLEKDLTLDLARRTRDASLRLGHDVRLTRDGDQNDSLRDRARAARRVRADAFVSIHFNASIEPSEAGCEVWIHDHAGPHSRGLADLLLNGIVAATGQARRGVHSGPMAVLDPRYHDRGTAACLAEVSFLTNPAEEVRLRSDGYRQRIAEAIAHALAAWGRGRERSVHAVREEFDVWHEVPLVWQLTGMSCWAAAAAMLVGWRDCIEIDPEQVARASGRWEAYRDGLEPDDVKTLADAWGLVAEPPRSYTVADLRQLLEANGPLWIGEASPGLHVIVVAGMYGDGTPDGSFVRIADPWPIGRGERYTITFREFMQNLDAVAGIAGGHVQVLHTGGRRTGNRHVYSVRSEVHARVAGNLGE